MIRIPSFLIQHNNQYVILPYPIPITTTIHTRQEYSPLSMSRWTQWEGVESFSIFITSCGFSWRPDQQGQLDVTFLLGDCPLLSALRVKSFNSGTLTALSSQAHTPHTCPARKKVALRAVCDRLPLRHKMYKYLSLLLVIGLARANTVDIDGLEAEEGDERTIFTSGGTYYIALNTTYLLIRSLLLGGILLGALFLAGGSGASSDSGYGSQYGGYGQRKSGFEENFNRNKRDLFEYGKTPHWGG